jgi:hypothetical protein
MGHMTIEFDSALQQEASYNVNLNFYGTVVYPFIYLQSFEFNMYLWSSIENVSHVFDFSHYPVHILYSKASVH